MDSGQQVMSAHITHSLVFRLIESLLRPRGWWVVVLVLVVGSSSDAAALTICIGGRKGVEMIETYSRMFPLAAKQTVC